MNREPPAACLKRPVRRQRRWWIKLLAGSLSFLLAIVIAESLARWLKIAPDVQAIRLHDPKSPYQRSTNAILRYELRPGFRGPLNAQHQYLRTTPADFLLNSSSAVTGTVTINSHGLRDRERTTTPEANSTRVILLGDSVVEMINYVSDEATISRLMEQKLAAATEVLNFGCAGYCTRAEVELLEVKGLDFRPDVVIVVFVENDYWGYNLEHAVGGATLQRPAIVNQLFVHSALLRAASLELNLFGFADEQNPAKWHREAVGENNIVSGFARLNELSKQHHFEVIVAFWPSFLKDGIDYRYELQDPALLLAEPIAWHFGFDTVRLAPFFHDHWKSLSPQPQPEWYYACGDGMHPSAIGCDVAADALCAILQDPNLRQHPPDAKTLAAQYQACSAAAAELALLPESETTLTEQVAMVLKRQNRFVEADQFTAAASRSPDAPLNELLAEDQQITERYLQAGAEFEAAGQLFAARDMFERAALREPERIDVKLRLAAVLTQMNDADNARTVLNSILKQHPSNTQAQEMLRTLSP